MKTDNRPLILHVMFRFDTGGLENGVVNLINHLPEHLYRHAVLALTEVTDFRKRILRDDVQYFALNKGPGQGFWKFPVFFKLMRQLRPTIVHTRNLAALEFQAPAWAAGVPIRIHGEHGRDVGDLDGSNVTHQRLRRFYKPFVSSYVALSRDLASYLSDKIGVPSARMTQVYNGVDIARFGVPPGGPLQIEGCPFNPQDHWLVGTVGRMQTVKDQTMLAQAFVQALALAPELHGRLRLVMIGEGPLRVVAQAVLESAGVAHLAWLPGERSDIPTVLQGLHAFALPSLAEGISNTILEAMASGLAVVATDVGGNSDLVQHGETGYIVPPANPAAMAQRLAQWVSDPDSAWQMGQAGRLRVEKTFSMSAMIDTYCAIYDQQLQNARWGKV